ncbi:hypothetical protein ACFE04_007622 [Oxalis oulophora]
MGSMKVHQLARGFTCWETNNNKEILPSLTLGGCKRLRPLAPKLSSSSDSSFDLKSFIKPDCGPPNKPCSPQEDPSQVDTHPGGTRWNPTQEQIGILETLYRGGMRTPNAQQIEQITSQLAKYGKIEGKNVFYWFQNHKARERQKQKRNRSSVVSNSHSPKSPRKATSFSLETMGEFVKQEEDSPYKRKCKIWAFESLNERRSWCKEEEEDLGDGTLELFPLHPEN